MEITRVLFDIHLLKFLFWIEILAKFAPLGKLCDLGVNIF